jgi:adenylate kinase family enzyme
MGNDQPEHMNRVLIAGVSGAGKTTLARKIEARLGLPHHELDALHHGPGWVKRPEFESDVDAFTAEPCWVTEEQYHPLLGDMLWQRADTLIWLDLPRSTVMWRVIRRSFRYAITRKLLWNGNRERFRDWISPGHPIRWAWAQHGRRKRVVAERIAMHPKITVIRLSSAREARDWVRSALPPSTVDTTDPDCTHHPET